MEPASKPPTALPAIRAAALREVEKLEEVGGLMGARRQLTRACTIGASVMAYYRSRITRNRVREYLGDSWLKPRLIGWLVGVDLATVRAFTDDPRLIPDLQLALRFSRRAAHGGDGGILIVDPPGASIDAAHPKMVVTICGAGNLGHVFAGLLGARQDIETRLLVSSAERAEEFRHAMQLEGGVRVRSPDGTSVLGRPALVTHDAAAAIRGAELILLCVPSHVEAPMLERILPHVDRDDACVGSIPAPGGFDWKARDVLARHGKANAYFGLGFIPWMCKTAAFGREVRILGGKSINVVAVHPPAQLATVADRLTRVVQTPVLDVGSFLNLTLHPGNQVLHPAIGYSWLRDWDGTPFPEAPLLYEGVSAQAAELCRELGDEIMVLRRALAKAMPQLALPLVMPLLDSLKTGYGAAIADARTLQSAIASNSAYAGIRMPMRKVQGGCLPDWQSRFFLEDIPHGLAVLHGLAELLAVDVPRVDEILTWAQRRLGKEYLVDGRLIGKDVAQTGAPQCHGIRTVADLVRAEGR
jgi:hypothetical protein